MINYTHLKTFDLFQTAIPISYKNNHIYKSNLGGILTIISFLIIFIYSLIEISILFDRSAFTIVSNEYHDLGGSIDFTLTPILLQLLDKTGNVMEYDIKLFSFSAIYNQFILENIDGEIKRINKKINLEIERCDLLKKIFPALDNFSNYNLTKYMCIKPNQSLILFGISDDLNNNYKSLEIKINKCEGNNCYNSKIMEDLIENSIFTVSYLGYATNFTDNIIQKNIVYKVYRKYVTLSHTLIKKINYGFNKCKLTLYDNMIISNKIEFDYFSYQNFFEDFFIPNISNNDSSLAYFNFNYNGLITEFKKEINGLGSVILNICTFFNIIVLIARNINNYYGNKILFSDIYFNFLLKNGRLRSLSKTFDKKEESVLIKELLNKSIKNNNLIVDNSNSNIVNNINLFNYRNNNSLKRFNFLNSKITKKQFDYNISRKDILKFYFYPYCLMKKNKKLFQIKEQISILFSIENFFDVLQVSNSSGNAFYEQILKYVLNENYGKTVSRDNVFKSDINLKNLFKNDNEFQCDDLK